MTTIRWHQKADALVQGWSRVFGYAPTLHAVVLALSVAQHETRCGDSWPGEFDWGATTLRALTAAERKVLADAGIYPTIGAGRVEAAARAQAALEAAGLAPSNGVIHCDSTTDDKGTHPYFVYFFRGQDDADGARYFVHLLAEKKAAKAVLETPAGTEQGLAQAMYRAGYFWGFHPHKKYVGKDGKEHDGNQENVDDYANSLRALTPGIRLALKDWVPMGGPVDAAPPKPAPFQLKDRTSAFEALRALGCVRPHDTAFSDAVYLASLGFYQGGNMDVRGELLDVDGDLGKDTAGAMARDLKVLGLEIV